MNKRILIYGSLLIAAVIIALVGVRLLRSPQQPSEKEESTEDSQSKSQPPSSTVPAKPDTSKLSADDKKRMVETLKQMLTKMGLKEAPSVDKFLSEEVKSGDNGRILRAFHDAIYSRNWPMSDVIPALKIFLNDPNPYVRYNASWALLTAGDKNGYSTLLALVQANDPAGGIGEDLRIQAAQTLARFRDRDAIQAIYNLYQTTRSGYLIEALQILAPDQAGALIPPKNYYNDPLAITDYGVENYQQFLPQITNAFQNNPKPDVKVAAAWALATMTGNQNAINYLVQIAQPAITAKMGAAMTAAPGQPNFAVGEQALKYLGSLQNPQAKETLEAALDSQIPSVVEIATANLLFNQGGSDKAVQVIANQLNDSSHATLQWDFTLNVAAQLSENPKIQAAGRAFSQHESIVNQWQLYTVERRNWPIYNWIDDYVVKLNK